jgi:hypothetical protein
LDPVILLSLLAFCFPSHFPIRAHAILLVIQYCKKHSWVYKKLVAIAPNESIVCTFYDDGHFLGPLTSLVAIGDAIPAAHVIVSLTVAIRTNGLYSPLGVGDALDNLPRGHTMRGVHVSTEGAICFLGGALRTSDYARDVFETALMSKYETYGERLTGLAAHRHSYTALRIHQHCNRRFGHFARTAPHGLNMGESYGDTVVVTIPKGTYNATLDVAAEIFGPPAC